MAVTNKQLSGADRRLVLAALRSPRGHYFCERASQLSGIPARTLRDWRQSGVLTPDWSDNRPAGWSYRDIVYARLLAWLRSKRMSRHDAAERVGLVRSELEAASIDSAIADDPLVRSDGKVLLIAQEQSDRITGVQVFADLIPLLDVFTLVEPIEGVSRGALWGPSLIRPSEYTYISPNVVAGEPCIVNSRIPTGSIHALHTERGMSADDIRQLYPQLEECAVNDAIELERRLQGSVSLEAA